MPTFKAFNVSMIAFVRFAAFVTNRPTAYRHSGEFPIHVHVYKVTQGTSNVSQHIFHVTPTNSRTYGILVQLYIVILSTPSLSTKAPLVN